MAEPILSIIAEGIIGWLSSKAVEEVGLLWGVNNELAGLQETIMTIKAVLLDAEEKQAHNHQVRTWLGRLEAVVSDVDDLKDEFSYEAHWQKAMADGEVMKKVCTFFSASNQVVFRHKLGHKIKAIKERLIAIRDDKPFHLEEKVVNIEREPTHSYIPENEVIGRDKDRMEILKILLDSNVDENVSVISIVGSGGLGKTTLTQLVYNDDKVKRHFDLRMWVYVSNDFNVKSLVEKIIKAATNRGLENLEIDQLQKLLQKEISGKRYLLVLDDVWIENHEPWKNLKNLLANCASGSKIIITTRNIKVAESTSKMKPYILGRFDKDESWSLFKKVAFKHGQEPNDSTIVEIGKKIVEHCGGNPLAIKTIGRMFYFKNPEKEWSPFLELEFSKLPQKEHDILPTLKLSYHNLPLHLKHCFAICKLFPKGHEFSVEILTNLWMALGYIKPSYPTKSLVDVGHEYFMDLLCRSFFQEIQGDILDKRCQMHDLMHDLATQVGGTEYVLWQPNKKSNFENDTRHVSFNFHLDSLQRIPTTVSKENRIRTILLLGQSSSIVEGRRGQSICDVVVSNFKFVRFLDLHNLGIRIVPTCIGKLKHLRYLDLSKNKDVKALPDSITMLCNLQTLKLSYCKGLQKLPKDIKRLVNLVNLSLQDCIGMTHMPHGLSQLTNLQTLSQFVLKDATSTSVRRHNGEVGELKDLMGLNNLRGELAIYNLGNGEDTRTANLREKQHLISLLLCWRSVDSSNLKDVEYEATLEGLQPHLDLKLLVLQYYEGEKFSSWFQSLTKLEYFIVEYCMKCQYLPSLNQFLSLKLLHLRNVLGLEYISNNSFTLSSTAVLPSLESLFFIGLPNLKGWWKEEQVVVDSEEAQEDHECSFGTSMSHILLSFPRLSDFNIYNCPKFSLLPLSPNIKLLSIQNNTWKAFQQAVTTKTQTTIEEAASSSSSLFHFSNLSKLALFEVEDLQCLPEWLKNITFLRTLAISRCINLKCLSPGIQHLASSLQELTIEGCKELDMSHADDNVLTWRPLKSSLRSLVLTDLPQMRTLPKGLQYVTNLQELEVGYCQNLIEISEWISNLNSLKMLKIIKCPKLTSLPEGVQRLTSLHKLEIEDCPILYKRCQREIGQDWPKVAHITELILKSNLQDKSESSSTFPSCNWKVFNKSWISQFCNKGLS
ncbi:putative disease resistance protein RGA1 [Ziziphus jujuba]|uniref:Disease resistance protein RGA1 n=1 Tax=Ziziphus jujuba TaxID=326968 RepID=A0A6P4A1J1_ZIZJJ|nr:putative disease resistance protein RGA1 [Ziziphus jujuba]XP_060670445.1 putative disease resistance protein RGA1 [Ziziphus jujuba]